MRIAGFRPRKAIGRMRAQAAPSTAFAAGCTGSHSRPVLASYGLTVHDDGSGSGFMLANRTGHQVMVNTLVSFGRRPSVSSVGLSIRSTPALPTRPDALTSDPREGRMRLTMLGGFLGSGKSTWLRHHLQRGLLQTP